MKIYRKTFINLTVAVLFVFTFLVLIQTKSESAFADTSRVSSPMLITTRNGFIQAIKEAEDGETIYVGDIDFNLQGSGAVNDAARVAIEKSISVKNGKKEGGHAQFTGGSVILSGGSVIGKKMNCTFEGIAFEGGIDTKNLTAEDWALAYDGMGELISPVPLKAQYAAEFRGNVKAEFNDCTFSNYMYPSGGALNAFYSEFSENKVNELDLVLNECAFTENAAKYAGGAIYLAGNKKNVKVTVSNCTFERNTSEYGGYCDGGGAVYGSDCILSFASSSFIDNSSDRVYVVTEDKPASQNLGCGGAINTSAADASFTDCVFAKNVAVKGGAISLWTGTSAIIDGCIFAYNRAEVPAPFTAEENILTDGVGGAVYMNGKPYVSFVNSSVYGNYAQTAYASVYNIYSEIPSSDAETNFGKVSFEMCTVANNTCGKKLTDFSYYSQPNWKWFGYPGDFWSIPYIDVAGSLIADDTFAEDYPRCETPSEQNGYNYFASYGRAVTDGILPSAETNDTGTLRHVYAAGGENFRLPESFVHGIVRDRFIEVLGDFYVGSNYNSEVKVVLVTNGGTIAESEMNYTYGTPLVLPTVEKKWHTFDGWFTADGRKISDGSIVVSPSVETLTLAAHFTNIFPYGTVIGASFGGIAFLGIAAAVVILLLKRRRQSPESILVAADAVLAEEQKSAPDTSNLTDREKQVLDLLLQGKKRNEIGEILYISEATVKRHISSIYLELEVSSRSELFAKFHS